MDVTWQNKIYAADRRPTRTYDEHIKPSIILKDNYYVNCRLRKMYGLDCDDE